MNKIVELLKSEHRSKSIADCWLHIETTCLFDPDSESKRFAVVAAKQTVFVCCNSQNCLHKVEAIRQQANRETGRLKSVQSYHSYLVYLTQCCLQSGTAFNRVCIYIVCLFTLKYTCFSRGFIVNINYVYTALLLVCSRQQKKF